MTKRRITKSQMEEVHPHIPSAYESLVQGRISRREFMRTSTLLGMGAGVAALAAACGTQEAADSGAAEPVEEAEVVVEEPTAAPEPTDEPEPEVSGKRGGTIRVGSDIKAVDHPARYSWIFDANQTRMVYEYLTETDKDNITHPYLLDNWEASDDLTTWTLNLRKGVLFSNGDELKAEHVLWNMEQWLNVDVGSSILGLWEGFLPATGIEVVDEYTIRLNLDAPLLAVPEQLFHYPAQIIHPSFDGDISSGNTPGTGPHVIDEYVTGERVRTVARWANGDETYWQMGDDGKPLTYYEALEWVALGEDATAYVAAIQGGQIDAIYSGNVGPDTFLALQGNPDIEMAGIPTSNTRVWRMRQDQDPWTDIRLVNAVKKVQDREKILAAAFFDEGIVGYDTHISPVHPAWSPMDVPAYDPEGAMALLAEAGVESLDFDVSVGTGWPDVVSFAETVQQDAKAANINITLDTMPNAAFWDLWSETTVGITPWTHRPLAVMLLPLAYIGDADGNPVPWNETRWIDQEFMDILKEAQGTLDVEARRVLTGQLQQIQQERNAVLISYFMNVWQPVRNNIKGVNGHPTNYNLWQEAWVEQA